MRRNITLIRHLDDPVANRDPSHPPPAPQTASPPASASSARSRTSSSARTPTTRRGLAAELQERLEQPELVDDIDRRPVPEIIADICRDLGLAGLAQASSPGSAAPPPTSPTSAPAPPSSPLGARAGPIHPAAVTTLAKPRLWPPAHDAP